MTATNDSIYLGIKGHVVAIDRQTGTRLWETKLKGSDFVNIVFDQGVLIAHTKGELWSLDPESGREIWHNGLSGLGYGYVTMASATMMVSPQLQSVLEQIRSDKAAAAASSSSGTGAGAI
jgi:outer membrane protein assembly factor BamB